MNQESEETQGTESEDIVCSRAHSPKLKILTTCAVLFGNIAFGFGFNFYGPVLNDLRIKYDTTVDHISVIFTIMLIAYCMGALTSGFIYSYVMSRQLGAIVCLGVMGFSLFLAPHLNSIAHFFILCGFFGYFIGGYDTAQIVWLIEIWQSKAGSYIQGQNFCYALGTIIAPLVIQPFLSPKKGEDISNQTTTTTTTTPSIPENPLLYIPFTIGGAFLALASSFQLYLFLFHRYYTPPPPMETESKTETEGGGSHDHNASEDSGLSETDSLIPNSTSSLNSTYSESDVQNYPRLISRGINWSRLRFIVLSAMFLSSYSGMEVCTIQFIPVFAQYSHLKLSGSEGALILSGLTGAFAFGRFIGIFVILLLPPHLMLCGNLSLALVGNLLLYLYGSSDLTLLWIGSIIIGLGYSTTYATFCVFMEKHLVFTNGVGSCMIVAGSTLAAIYPLVIGNRIVGNVEVLTYTNFISICTCSIVLFTLYALTYRNKSKVG